jgi:hypothetical protein
VAVHEAGVGRWAISEELRAFVQEMPYERRSIIAFVRDSADSISPAQLLRNVGSAMGREPDGRDAERAMAAELLAQLGDRFAALAPLDVNRILPLGWSVRARLG